MELKTGLKAVVMGPVGMAQKMQAENPINKIAPEDRKEYAKEQMLNAYKGHMATSAVATSVAATALLTAKSSTFKKMMKSLADTLSKPKFVQNTIGDIKGLAKKVLNEDAISKLKAMPAWGKVAAALSVPAALLIVEANHKRSFNAGKIQQKYEDKSAQIDNEKISE